MFKNTFSLVSHTPVIHFEKLSKLALRPTELKSKFDKFLIFNNYVSEDKIHKDTQNRKYLKYKVKIKNIKISSKEDIQKNDRFIPFYFGNMGDDYHSGDKKLVFFDNIDIEFFSFDTELLEVISKRFEEFIAITNFGTRQNKGYGSFYLKDKKFNEKYINGYKVFIKAKDYKKAMEQIEIFYKFIRSGINLPRPYNPFYIKPAIWKYFNERGIIWEKKAIKRRCFNGKLNEQKNRHNNSDILVSEGDEKIVRDLLGLSTSQSWRSYGINVTKESITEDKEIKRFKSPLMFKFIKNGDGYDVYFWNEKRDEEKLKDFCGKTFRINAGRCNFELDVAKFDLDHFLNWLYNRKKTILSKLSDDVETNEYKTIKKILNNLKKVN